MTDREALREEIAAVCLAHLKPPKFAGGSWTLNPTECAEAVLAVLEPALAAARNDMVHLERVVDEARHNESKARAALVQRDAVLDYLRGVIRHANARYDASRDELIEARRRLAAVEAAVRLCYPDDLTPAGKRIIDSALASGDRP